MASRFRSRHDSCMIGSTPPCAHSSAAPQFAIFSAAPWLSVQLAASTNPRMIPTFFRTSAGIRRPWRPQLARHRKLPRRQHRLQVAIRRRRGNRHAAGNFRSHANTGTCLKSGTPPMVSREPHPQPVEGCPLPLVVSRFGVRRRPVLSLPNGPCRTTAPSNQPSRRTPLAAPSQRNLLKLTL